MHTLVEDFLQYLRHERGQSLQTQKTYSALLGKFVQWAEKAGIDSWKAVQFSHLTEFLQYERSRKLGNPVKDANRKLSSESVYLEIAAFRAFFRFAESEQLLPANIADN